ncbi:GNAT family N-acetyltransferase [Candidatus Stoquefichus massiliensis]|uniref:GNAT family N-acetyltransferase n=1 Tax=Candidatus Stoquefichus massiliensis TaxID=1470350 RepID=UPI0004887B48|nr:GNAT family N-acetyltransferase [Candidatus Stoquefichus massiliensis]
MIEQAKLHDQEEIYQLICILEDKEINKDHFMKVFQNGLENNDVEMLVYKKENQILGFISLYIHHYLHHDDDTGEIVELVVKPNYRGLRIGERLITRIEEFAKECHLEQIELSTSTYRKKAHQFYEAHGYKKDHYNYTKDLKL